MSIIQINNCKLGSNNNLISNITLRIIQARMSSTASPGKVLNNVFLDWKRIWDEPS